MSRGLGHHYRPFEGSTNSLFLLFDYVIYKVRACGEGSCLNEHRCQSCQFGSSSNINIGASSMRHFYPSDWVLWRDKLMVMIINATLKHPLLLYFSLGGQQWFDRLLILRLSPFIMHIKLKHSHLKSLRISIALFQFEEESSFHTHLNTPR